MAENSAADDARLSDEDSVRNVPDRPFDEDEAVLWDERYGGDADDDDSESDGQDGNQQAATDGESAAAPPPDDAEDDADSGDGGPMVPKARLDAVLQQRKEAEEEALIQRGRADALAELQKSGQFTDPATGPGQQQQQMPSVDQLIQDLRQQKLTMAQKFDDADIGMTELRRFEQQADDQIAELIRQQRTAQEPAPQNEDADSLYLQERTLELFEQYPMAAEIPDDHPVWQTIQNEAWTQLEASGELPRLSTEMATLRLRQHMGELAEVYAPAALRMSANTANQPTQTGRQDHRPTADQRRKKMEMADQHPMDTGQVGVNRQVATEISDQDIMSMEEDEIAELPPSLRAKFMAG